MNTTHSAQLQHKGKLCIKPLVVPFFSMSLINNLKFVYSFCAHGLKHFQLMHKTWSKNAGSKKRQDEDTPLHAIIHPNYRHRICTTDIAAPWGGRGAGQRARNVSNKLGHLFQGCCCYTWEVRDELGLTLRTAQLLIQFAFPWEWIGRILLDKASPAF